MHTTQPPVHRRRSPRQVRAISSLPAADNQDTMGELLFNAGVLPEQFFDPQASRYAERPEAALMRAVLEDALACFQEGLVSGRRRAQRLAREAEEWFFSDDAHWLFSFVSICAVLGLESTYIRRGLRCWGQHRPNTAQQEQPHVVRAPQRLAA